MGGILSCNGLLFYRLTLALLIFCPSRARRRKSNFIMLDGIARRKVIKEEVEGLIHMIGFILLIILILAITYKDIAVLITS